MEPSPAWTSPEANALLHPLRNPGTDSSGAVPVFSALNTDFAPQLTRTVEKHSWPVEGSDSGLQATFHKVNSVNNKVYDGPFGITIGHEDRGVMPGRADRRETSSDFMHVFLSRIFQKSCQMGPIGDRMTLLKDGSAGASGQVSLWGSAEELPSLFPVRTGLGREPGVIPWEGGSRGGECLPRS